MHKRDTSLYRIFAWLLVFGICLSLGIPQAVSAQDNQPPTVSSGPEVETAPDQRDQAPTFQSSYSVDTDSGVPAQADAFADSRVNSSVLWDQPLSTVNTNAYVDQTFPDYPVSSSYLADDFVAVNLWSIKSIFIPGGGWNGFTSLLNASVLTWQIYADYGGIPAGDPSGGGNPPIWSLALPPNSPRVELSTGSGGFASNVNLELSTPLNLAPGHYWLVFYPTMTFGEYGQYGRQPADTTNGYVAQFINPGGGFGYGTAWQSWAVLGPVQNDMAFRIMGEASGGEWKSIKPINGDGRSRPAAASVGGKLYVFGGETPGGGRANTVEKYDPSTGTWTTQAGLMPVPASNVCAAAIGSDIYIPGGFDISGVYLNTLQVYHTGSDTWSTIPTDPLPIGVAGPGCAALSGKLYAFGGTNGVYQSSTFVYDPAAAAGARWTILASMTFPRSYLAGVVVNGKVYAVGGRDGGTENFPYVEAYNPADSSWHTLTNMNQARGGPGAYSLGKYLVVCGGGWSTYLNTCERYDTTQGYGGSWSPMASLIEGRRTFAYTQAGSALYAVAGYKSAYLTSAERWSIDSFLPLVSNTDFTTLGFDSQFNGEAIGWFSYGGTWYIGGSTLFTEGVDNYSSSAAHVNNYSDFDYTARMIRHGCDTCANRLIIRGTPDPLDSSGHWYKEYTFQYSRDGHYSVYKRFNAVETPLQVWAASPAIHTGDAWNILRVVADGSQLYFFINGTLVWSGTDTSFASGMVGIGMYRSSSIPDNLLEVDWATLWSDNKSMIMETVSPEQQMLNEAANLNGNGDINNAP